MTYRNKNFGKSPFDPDYDDNYDRMQDYDEFCESLEDREQFNRENR